MNGKDLFPDTHDSVLHRELVLRITELIEEESSGLDGVWATLPLSCDDERTDRAKARLHAAVDCAVAPYAPSNALSDLIKQLDSDQTSGHQAQLLRILGALVAAQDALTSDVLGLVGRSLNSTAETVKVAALNILADPRLHNAPRSLKERAVSMASSATEVGPTRTPAMRAARHLRDRVLATQTVVGLIDIQHEHIRQTVALERICRCSHKPKGE